MNFTHKCCCKFVPEEMQVFTKICFAFFSILENGGRRVGFIFTFQIYFPGANIRGEDCTCQVTAIELHQGLNLCLADNKRSVVTILPFLDHSSIGAK